MHILKRSHVLNQEHKGHIFCDKLFMIQWDQLKETKQYLFSVQQKYFDRDEIKSVIRGWFKNYTD